MACSVTVTAVVQEITVDRGSFGHSVSVAIIKGTELVHLEDGPEFMFNWVE
jgi:hypothetical protein